MSMNTILQSCDLAGPMSCDQMRLIWVSDHMIANMYTYCIMYFVMGRKTGKECFYFINVMGYNMQKITIWGKHLYLH